MRTAPIIWPAAAVAVGGFMILFGPAPPGVDLEPLRQAYGGWIWVVTVLAGAIPLGWALRSLVLWVRIAFARPAVSPDQRGILRKLDDVSEDDYEVLGHYLRDHLQTILCPVADPRVKRLREKGFLVPARGIHNPRSWPHTVPRFVWDELQRRRASGRTEVSAGGLAG